MSYETKHGSEREAESMTKPTRQYDPARIAAMIGGVAVVAILDAVGVLPATLGEIPAAARVALLYGVAGAGGGLVFIESIRGMRAKPGGEEDKTGGEEEEPGGKQESEAD